MHTMCLDQFLDLGPVDFLEQIITVKAVLCIVGSAAPAGSTLCTVVTVRNVSRYCQMSLGVGVRQNHPCLRTTVLDLHLDFSCRNPKPLNVELIKIAFNAMGTRSPPHLDCQFGSLLSECQRGSAIFLFLC